jgi:hypothetical protein
MTDDEREALIRRYAAGAITWHALQHLGFENYVQVLGRSANWGFVRR